MTTQEGTVGDGWYIISYPDGDILERVEDGRVDDGDGEFALELARKGYIFRPVEIIPAEERKRWHDINATQAARIAELTQRIDDLMEYYIGVVELQAAGKARVQAELEATANSLRVSDALYSGAVDAIAKLEAELAAFRARIVECKTCYMPVVMDKKGEGGRMMWVPVEDATYVHDSIIDGRITLRVDENGEDITIKGSEEGDWQTLNLNPFPYRLCRQVPDAASVPAQEPFDVIEHDGVYHVYPFGRERFGPCVSLDTSDYDLIGGYKTRYRVFFHNHMFDVDQARRYAQAILKACDIADEHKEMKGGE